MLARAAASNVRYARRDQASSRLALRSSAGVPGLRGAAGEDCLLGSPNPSHECYLVHLEPVQGLVTSDENYQKLGDFLLQEIRAKSSIKYPSLSELLTKLQVSCIESFASFHCCASCQIPYSAQGQTRNRLTKIIAICDFYVQNALPSKDMGDQISSLLMEQLGGVQYPDDLVTFFSDMSQLMHSHAQALDEDALKGKADISSAMGFYIRHCCVSFHMLAFEVCVIDQLTRQHLYAA